MPKRYRLEAEVGGDRRWTPIELGRTIGRDPSCDLALPSPRVSRVHASVAARGESLALVDRGSRNGLIVRGERVLEVSLEEGAEVSIGPFTLRVERGETPDLANDSLRVRTRIARGDERFPPEVGAIGETDWSSASVAPLFDRFELLYRCSVATAAATSERDVVGSMERSLRALYGTDRVVALRCEGEDEPTTWNDEPSPSPQLNEAVRRCTATGDAELLERSGGHALVAALRTAERTFGAFLVEVGREVRPTRPDLELLIGCAHLTALSIHSLRLRELLDARHVALVQRTRPSGQLLVGRSALMAELRDLISRVAPTDATVLIRGETGTGKELVAQALHEASPRADGPLVTVNCGALTDTLVSSELFGHEKGAFTGADRRRPGCFERAHGGTLFLDELGELELDAQVRLLRVLESGRVTPLGAHRAKVVDVRLVAATHQDLEAAVEAGRFREDLLYRVQVVELDVPPLRSRLEDLEDLAGHLLEGLADRMGRRAPKLSAGALAALASHDWPGNVRELRNVLERALIFARSQTLERSDLGSFRRRKSSRPPRSVDQTLEQVQAAHMKAVLEQVGWNKTRAAEILGIERSTVYKKLRTLEITPPDDD